MKSDGLFLIGNKISVETCNKISNKCKKNVSNATLKVCWQGPCQGSLQCVDH